MIPNQPIRDDDGTWLKSSEENAESYAKYIGKVFTPNIHITNSTLFPASI